jgi:hypothetical protein
MFLAFLFYRCLWPLATCATARGMTDQGDPATTDRVGLHILVLEDLLTMDLGVLVMTDLVVLSTMDLEVRSTRGLADIDTTAPEGRHTMVQGGQPTMALVDLAIQAPEVPVIPDQVGLEKIVRQFANRGTYHPVEVARAKRKFGILLV